MTENKRYRKVMGLIENTDGETFDLTEIVNLLNEQEERIKDLKETIIKITIAYQRKHNNTIVNLVDEVHEEDITDLMEELKE